MAVLLAFWVTMRTVTSEMRATLDNKGVVLPCAACGRRNRVAYERLGHSARCGACKSEIRPLAQPLEVASQAEFDALVRGSSLPVLADFWAPWCGPCKMLAPELQAVAAQTAGELIVLKVNTDDVPELAQRYRISSIPTLTLLQSGTESSRLAGARPAEAILGFVRQTTAAH